MEDSISLYRYIARKPIYDWIDLHQKRIWASQEVKCIFWICYLANNSNGRFVMAKGSRVPSGGQQKVDGLAVGIDRAIQVFPLTFDFDVGFIHSPPPTYCALMSAKGLIQQRHKADILAMKRGMINDNSALSHHLFEIAQAEWGFVE